MSASEAFAFMSDMRLFASWDPSIIRAVQVAGRGPGPDAVVDLVFAGVGPARTLRYRVVEFEPGRRMAIEARTRLLTSYDVVLVEPAPGGAVVTYDAEFTVSGPLAVAEPAVAVAFRLLSDRAAAGLQQALTGSA
jgi:hypothetical protein